MTTGTDVLAAAKTVVSSPNAIEIISVFAAVAISANTITPAAILVAFPTDVTSPVKFAFVVTVPAVRLDAVPLQFVNTPAEGVPISGVVNVGEVRVLLVKVFVDDVVTIFTPSMVTTPLEALAIVVSVA